jgi:hypothetical protein
MVTQDQLQAPLTNKGEPSIAVVAWIAIYPLKSFDPLVLDQVDVLPAGCLENDRRFAFISKDGHVLNAKRSDRVHRLAIACDCVRRMAVLSSNDRSIGPISFHLDADRDEMELWLSDYFETEISIVENGVSGFPDDTIAPGPTVITTQTLRTVASWFDGISLDEARRRFRANIEIDASAPFWEDRLFGPAGTFIRFRVGDVCFEGTNPCARCPVPARNSYTGERNPQFASMFQQQRKSTLPVWAESSRFDHFYRLAVNTRPVLPLTGATIHVGDPVEILS